MDLNWVGIVLAAFGLLYMIYSVIFRKKVTIYNKSVKMIIGKDENYLKLQLYFSIANAIWLIAFGTIIIIYNFSSAWILLLPILFHIVNWILKITARRKGYIE